jgi:hypothetical protein
MTTRKRPPAAGGRPGSGEVVNLTARSVARLGYKRAASADVARARAHLGMTRSEFAEYLSGELGAEVTAEMVAYWEDVDAPLGEVLKACWAVTGGATASGSLLDDVPRSFPASALAGPWVTAYEFRHGDRVLHHADVAHVGTDGDRRIWAVNSPPSPRTEGRTRGFGNEIEAELAGRHLVGLWRNTTDARYFGSLQLAVEPGENVMDGYYTGLASDVTVSVARWRWVRLDVAEGADLPAAALLDPAAVFAAVMGQSFDAPIKLADITGES